MGKIAKRFLSLFVVIILVVALVIILVLAFRGTLSNRTHSYNSKKVSESGQVYSADNKDFAITLNNDNLIVHSMKKYSPAMSSVIGLKIKSTYEGKADKIRYTATEGTLMRDINTKNRGKTLTVPVNTSIYWSPLTGDDKSLKADKIIVKVEALNAGIEIAEQTLCINKEGLVYSIEENTNVLADIK